MPRVYVGNLPVDIRESELEDLFYKYGRIREIDIKRPPRPPAFAFISYDDIRDAEDAVYARDGYNFDGCRLRCELSKDTGGRFGGGGRGGYDDRGRGGGGGYGRDDGYGQRGRGGGGGGKRTEFGVMVTNLPRSTSWQDLKDFFRKAGDVVYTDVNNNTGDGIVEFSNREDMETAIDKLDDTEFKNRYDAAFIRVKRPPNASGRDDRDRSPARSPARRDDRDRSRSRSRDRSDHRDRKDDDDEDRRERSKSDVDRDDKPSDDKAKDDDKDDDKEDDKEKDVKKGDDEEDN